MMGLLWSEASLCPACSSDHRQYNAAAAADPNQGAAARTRTHARTHTRTRTHTHTFIYSREFSTSMCLFCWWWRRTLRGGGEGFTPTSAPQGKHLQRGGTLPPAPGSLYGQSPALTAGPGSLGGRSL